MLSNATLPSVSDQQIEQDFTDLKLTSSSHLVTDSCQVNNGGCDSNAICSHDGTSNAVKCTCKTGYSNVGSDSNVVCKGEDCRGREEFV